MTLKSHVKFEEKLACTFKNDMRNLANFHQSTFESLKTWTFVESFYPKQKMYELNRGVMSHYNEE